ncbi:hypothetical protein [Kitasatospora sp. NPDC004289]
MRWTFERQAGVTAAAGVVLLAAAVLTWLPGLQPWAGNSWLVLGEFGVVLGLAVAMFVRVARMWPTDRQELGWAMLSVPRTVLGGLLLLFVTAGVVTESSIRIDGALQDASARGGHYYAHGATPEGPRGEVEITRAQYEEVAESDTRAMEAAPAAALAVIAALVLAAGELRPRAGR